MTRRTALITGASRGLGAFLASRFHAAGYDLFLVARDKAALRELQEMLASRAGNRGRVEIASVDLGDPSAMDGLAAGTLARLGRCDVLVNNAAIHGPVGPLAGCDWDHWEEAIAVDLLSPVALCRALLPHMVENGGGSIVNLSGGGATGPRPNFTAYATAKAGLVRFTETLAHEVSGQGVRVNAIAPGAMNTSMTLEILKAGAGRTGEHEQTTARKVRDGTGSPMDTVADLALFLASDASIGISGRLVSAVWDKWAEWPQHLEALQTSDAYTLRRVTGRDRGFDWGDK